MMPEKFQVGNAKHDIPDSLLESLANASASIAGVQSTMLDWRALRQTLQQRMQANDITHPNAYLELYATNTAEQFAFLEGILNGETSFFRDANVFAEMARWCLDWFMKNPRPMRILSAPCATGEEPYSIAALLSQAGIALDRFTIEAIDISRTALTIAKAATYNGFSLRNIPRPENASFLEPVPEGWRVKEPLQQCIHFQQANLLDENALAPQAFDLICSRNLLIYQSSTARSRVASNLATALADGGRLVLGAADWGRDLDTLFRLEEPVHSFALRRRGPQDELPVQTTGATTKRSPSHSTKSPHNHSPALSEPMVRQSFDVISNELANVTDLYRRALEIYLHGDEKYAEKLCRQTLYLEPDHIPSLELLTRMKRPQASNRIQLALHARLKRHRDAAAGGVRR